MKNQFQFLKKLRYVIVFLMILFNGISHQAKAQLVLVPDSNFRALLNAYGLSSCFVGNYIDSTCVLVSGCTSLIVSQSNISNLTGIIAFKNLSSLYCNNNILVSLPILPNSLTILDCSGNQLTNLPTLPNSLTRLVCYTNQLANLPTLPNSLTYLNCQNNQLTNLPSLPNSLTYLYCGGNPLTNLPTLPNSLTILDCGGNQLTNLPTLPNSLIQLNCDHNQLTNLPTLPNSLTQLICFNNQLSNLPILPNSLISLYCDNNQLSNLPTLPNSLTDLYCSGNPNLSCLPELGYVTTLYFGGTGVTCLPNYGKVITSNPSLSSFPLCGFFNPYGCNSYWNISGKTYFDADTNCLFNNGDFNESNFKVNLYKNGNLVQQAFTGGEGYFSFDTDSLGIYKTVLDTIDIPFIVRCPALISYTDTLVINDTLKYDRNFSLKCKSGFDLAATSMYGERFVPGHNVPVYIHAGDFSNKFGAHCASGVGGVVSVIYSGAVNYVGPMAGALTPSLISGDTLTYTIANFGTVDFDSSFNFILAVDTLASIGSQVCISAAISPALDNNPTNNFISQCYTVLGSFDPNEKTVNPQSTLDINGDRWLTYTVSFQNTGTAPAEHIYITDTLDANLDLSTFQLLAYSHSPYVQILSGGIAKFNFKNINLPNSVSDEPASHVYVQYKIKAKNNLANNVQISNTAYIYFDFNTPIQTNVVSNTVVNCAQNIYNNTVSICLGEQYNFNGLILNQSGVYDQKYITASGCDSIVRITLTVQSISPQILQVQDTLFSSITGTSYQWLNCTSNAIISGAVSQQYSPILSGNYAVIVSSGNCKDTSLCYYISLTGISKSTADQISVSPNPSDAEFVVNCPQNIIGNNLTLKVFDTYGKLITTKIISSNKTILNAASWSKGIYFLEINCNGISSVRKLVME